MAAQAAAALAACSNCSTGSATDASTVIQVVWYPLGAIATIIAEQVVLRLLEDDSDVTEMPKM